MGRQAAHHAPEGASIRRRIDVTRLFTHRPGERLIVREVHEHTVGSTDQVRELLEELANLGWLTCGRSAAGHVAYWREEP